MLGARAELDEVAGEGTTLADRTQLADLEAILAVAQNLPAVTLRRGTYEQKVLGIVGHVMSLAGEGARGQRGLASSNTQAASAPCSPCHPTVSRW